MLKKLSQWVVGLMEPKPTQTLMQRAVGNVRKVYASNAERQRAYRQRVAGRKEVTAVVAPLREESIAPVVEPAPIVDSSMTLAVSNRRQSEPAAPPELLRALSALSAPAKIPSPAPEPEPKSPVKLPTVTLTREEYDAAVAAGVRHELALRDAAVKSVMTEPDEVKPKVAPKPAVTVIVDDMRTDLPPRTPAEIAELVKIETPEQTERRIQNDHQRYVHQRAGQPMARTQDCIIPAGTVHSAKVVWVRR